ncbi:sodium/hydrogen exchanger 9B2-like [Liolophura sinensis]|uniref:sodium/hydrogen exchanger 9B2-like n=1 Tax=Liolophura sinensis TaxID=3198878 RepID=UPI0031581152
MPALLGMLVMGAVLRNCPPIDIANNIEEKWSSSLRTIGLVIILVRAGLGLDPGALKKLSLVVVRLAFTPCLVEATTIAVASNLIVGFEWPWAFMQGFVIAAVSPAVVVPEMLKLVVRGYGIQQGVPTLVIAASSIDDVLALTGFSLSLVLAFATGNIADTVTKGPREVISGVIVGILYGLLMWYIPNKRNNHRTILRFFMLMGGAILFVFGTEDASLQSAGPIGCLTAAFVAAYKWRKQGWKGTTNPMNDAMGVAWNIFEPLMFGLIGAVVEVKNLDAKTVGLGCAVIGIGLLLRIVTTFCVISFAGFTFKEKLFIVFSWLPKGTVQAAIGSVAYDTAVRLNKGESAKAEGLEIITLAVLCILLTAPVGAWLMAVTGPRLLQRADTNPLDDVSEEEDSEAEAEDDEETGGATFPMNDRTVTGETNPGFLQESEAATNTKTENTVDSRL